MVQAGMTMRLTEAEIRRRLTRLRNLEQAYPKAQEQTALLNQENKELRSITPKGSHSFSINASVVLSQWWSDRAHWLPTMHRLLQA